MSGQLPTRGVEHRGLTLCHDTAGARHGCDGDRLLAPSTLVIAALLGRTALGLFKGELRDLSS